MPQRATAVALLLAAACGDPAASAFEDSLAALREGDLRRAETRAEDAAARGGDEYRARHDFVRGNVAYRRCELAEKQADTAAAEPFALDVAIMLARKAVRFWSDAAASRVDWPAARRNAERALLKLDALEKKKAERERKARQADPQPKPRPRPVPERKPETSEEPAPEEAPLLQELSRAEVLRLLEQLAAKEKEKLDVRRARRRERMAGVARDW